MQLRIVSCTNNSLSLPRRSTEFASPCVCLFPYCLTPTDIPVFVSSIQPAFRQISPRHALACTFVVHRYACVLFAYMCVDVLNVRTGASEVVFRGACRFFVVVFFLGVACAGRRFGSCLLPGCLSFLRRCLFPWCCVCGQALRKLSSGVPVVSSSSSLSLFLDRLKSYNIVCILNIDYIHDCVYYCFNYFSCSLSNYSQVNLNFFPINVCIFELFAIFPLPFLHVDAESFSSRGGMLGSRLAHTRTHSHPRTHLYRRALTFTLVLTFSGAHSLSLSYSPLQARTHLFGRTLTFTLVLTFSGANLPLLSYSPLQARTHLFGRALTFT